MRKLLQLHSYKRKEWEDLPIPKKSHDILKIPDDKVDVEVLAKKLISDKIENHEMNKLGFYDIVPDRFDLSNQSKKNPFKSMHNPNESYLIALNKFYEKTKYNYLERKLREELTNKTGNKLLLYEIYEQLDENNEVVVQKKKKIEENLEIFNYYKSETENHMVNNLEKWHKKSEKNSKLMRNASEVSERKKYMSLSKTKNEASQGTNLKALNESSKSLEKPNNEPKNKDFSLPKIVSNLRISTEFTDNQSPYVYSSLIKFPDINDKRKEREKLNEENFIIDDENLLESLKSRISQIISENFEVDSFTKKGLFIAKIVDNVLGKMNKRVTTLDAVLFKKNSRLIIVRKETSQLAEKIQSIKSLFLELNKDLANSQQIPLDTQQNKKKIDNKSPLLRSSKSMNTSQKMVNSGKLKNSLDEFLFNSSELNKQQQEVEENDVKPEYKLQLKGDLNFYVQKQRYNKRIIDETEEYIRPLKKEMKKLVKMRLNFLKVLLKKGKDFRNDGISWIIRTLWNLGEKIDEKDLPEYLDTKAKEFLFEKARQERLLLENETFKKISLEIYKSSVNKEDTQIYESFLSKTLFKEEEKVNNDSGDIIYEKSELSPEKSTMRKNPAGKTDKEENDNNILTKSMDANDRTSLCNTSKVDGEDKEMPYKFKTPDKKDKEIFKDPDRKEETSPFNLKIKKIIYKDLDTCQKEGKEQKKTIHDITYLETKRKIQDMVKSSIHQLDNTVLPYNDRSTLTFDISNLQNFDNYIMLYEDTSNINNYSNREDFIRKYDQNQKTLIDAQKNLEFLIDEEIIRIIKEYGFKSYETRFRIDLITVLCIMVGARRTRRELMKNGQLKK